MAPRTGRPRLPADEKRGHVFRVSVTEEEHKLLKAAGGSEWARGVLLRAAKRKT